MRRHAETSKPLDAKLGLKAGMVALVIDSPSDYQRLLGHVPVGVLFVTRTASDLDFTHVFVRERAILRRHLQDLRRRIRPSGMIWISWPKKAAGIPTDLTESVVREEALRHGLVDVKVCAVDATWSGLKLVLRLQNRG